jgi:hypothetical protein
MQRQILVKTARSYGETHRCRCGHPSLVSSLLPSGRDSTYDNKRRLNSVTKWNSIEHHLHGHDSPRLQYTKMVVYAVSRSTVERRRP